MPDYLAPGVYVEETGARTRRIEGVSTSIAGFVGPTRTGPTGGAPEMVTSVAEFERIYGSLDALTFANEAPTPNYLAHGVRAFFENGGRRLYVSRVYEAISGGDGRASATLRGAPGIITLTARFPGALPLQVTISLRMGDNVLTLDPLSGQRRLRDVTAFDLLYITDGAKPVGAAEGFHWVEPLGGTANPASPRWQLFDSNGGAGTAEHALSPTAEARVVTLAVEVGWLDRHGRVVRRERWDGLGAHPKHPRALSRVFGATLTSRKMELTVPLVFDAGSLNAVDMVRLLRAQMSPSGGFAPVQVTLSLANGNDGVRPTASAYIGTDTDSANATGLRAFEALADISIVAAPGYSADGRAHGDRMQAIALALIDHCERLRYRIAVLDSADGQSVTEVRALRARFDSSYAAMYYPWVRVVDVTTNAELLLPPSGFVAGIYARTDTDRGVHHAPANEVVRGAIGLELMLSTAQQELLNPEGVNALRWFEGRGFRVWGARTISSNPEWKYVNLRRYFAYLERSIEQGTQWVVFEPYDEALWATVRRSVEDFLHVEWTSGRLLGQKPEQAFFVRCDRSTMTQHDLDSGRLVCLVGVAPTRPAEFVMFRIGQHTADRRG